MAWQETSEAPMRTAGADSRLTRNKGLPMNNILVVIVWVIGTQVVLGVAKKLGFVYLRS